MKRGHMLKRRLVIAFLSAMMASGCAFTALEGRGVVPPPSSEPVDLSGAPSPHPFEFSTDRSGTLVRTIFAAEDDPRVRVTVKDFGVPPRHPTRAITLPAPAVLEILTEGGSVTMENKSTEFGPSGWLCVPAQTPFVLTNHTSQPLYVRAYMIEVKP